MPEISFKDIKKAYFTKSQSEKITLCYSGKVVNVKPIRMADKKEFLKYIEKEDDEQLNDFIDTLIEKYTADDDGNVVSSKTLVDEERHQILMIIRSTSTMNDKVNIDHICPECGTLNVDILFPLTSIKVNNYGDLDNVIMTNKGDVSMVISHLTRGEKIEIEKHIKDVKVETKVEKDFIYLASTIKELHLTVDDIVQKVVPTIKERVEFVESLSLDDFEKIRSFFKSSKEFGIELKFDFKCTKCNYKNQNEEAKIANFFIK